MFRFKSKKRVKKYLLLCGRPCIVVLGLLFNVRLKYLVLINALATTIILVVSGLFRFPVYAPGK